MTTTPKTTEATTQAQEAPSGGKMLAEFGPLILFFAVNAWRGIYWATGAFMIAMAVTMVATKMRGEKIPPMTIFTGVLVLVFGSLTLWLQNEIFIKVKVTILKALFGTILLVGLLTKRVFLKSFLGSAFQLDEEGWKRLTVRYIGFFYSMAALNEVVHRNVSTDTWVAFKTGGLIALTLLFTVMQVPLLQRHSIEEADSGDGEPDVVAGPESSTDT